MLDVIVIDYVTTIFAAKQKTLVWAILFILVIYIIYNKTITICSY